MNRNENDKITVIKSNTKWYEIDFKEFWRYRELILLFVKRNYFTRYKQTIMGPLWLLISPIFTIITYCVVFSGIANLSTDGIPAPVFYLLGNIVWTFFSANVSVNANTFGSNAGLFGKIYFPRLVIPFSTVIINFIDFCIQFVLLALIMIYYSFRGYDFQMNIQYIYILPILLIEIGMLGMGVGIIISALTTRYKDLNVLVGFGLNIWMYATPVIYATSLVPEKYMGIYMMNPMTPIMLSIKYILLGIGSIPANYLLISGLVTVLVFVIGIITFNRVEKTFLDTI